MIVLAIKTDNPQAELYVYNSYQKLAEIKWQAHLELSKTLHKQIRKILNQSSILADRLDGIVCFKGPGSFTGLRIGLSVANAMAYAYNIPIVATNGQNWVQAGIKELQNGKNQKIALPEYGRPANISQPRK